MTDNKKTVCAVGLALMFALLAGCGGGGGAQSPPDDPGGSPGTSGNWDSLVWDQGSWS